MNNIQSYEIILGKGFDKIKLGMSRKDIENILGEPDEIETHDYPEGGQSITLSYHEDGFDLTFESENDYKLSYISVFSDKFSLDNQIKVGQTKKEVLQKLNKSDFSEPEIEDVGGEEYPDNELAFLKNENINLWFSDEELDEIQFGPFWKDDETPVWP